MARALNVYVAAIRQRRQLLNGIHADVAELVKDKPVGINAFQKVRKMKPIRQLEVAELMVSANNYSANYAKALLVTTRPADLVKPDTAKKASGADSENYEEVRYEGYGPGGVAVIVEALTDNRNRTASSVRSTFSKAGGALGETGSVSFSFDRVGEITYKLAAGSADAVMEAAIEAGAEDVTTDEDGHTIICGFEDIGDVSKTLEDKLGEAETVKA